MADKGYPVGWRRQPGYENANYEHYELIEWFAALVGVDIRDAKQFPGSYAAIRTVGEIGSVQFSEADKAWYKPYPGGNI